MSDNKQWVKVYTAFLMDSHMMTLTMEDRGRWITLGALTAHNGTSGVLTIKSSLLSHLLHVTDDVTVLHEKVGILPNVKIACNGNGTCTVTFLKWHKYQVD